MERQPGGKTITSGLSVLMDDASMSHWYWIISIGFVAGLLSGLLGVGGGIILVPAMVYLLNMSQHEAHGTSLAVILFAAVFGTISYNLAGDVDWVMIAGLSVGGIIGAPLGAWTTKKVHAEALRKYFGLLLVFVGLRLLVEVVDVLLIPGKKIFPDQILQLQGVLYILLIGFIGLATGFLSGFLGVGGGVIMVPAMTLLFGTSQQLAQGNSLAVIIPISISGLIVHYHSENVNTFALIWLAIGAVVGSPIGSQIAVHVDATVLTSIFALLLIVIGVRMIKN